MGGLPGSGKTRLLQEAAARWQRGPVTWLDPLAELPPAAAGGQELLVVDGLDLLGGESALALLTRLARPARPVLAASRTRLMAPDLGLSLVVLDGLGAADAAALYRSASEALGCSMATGGGAGAGQADLLDSLDLSSLGGHPGSLLGAALVASRGAAAVARAMALDALPEGLDDQTLELLRACAAASIPLRREWLEMLSPAAPASIGRALRAHALLPGARGLALAAPLRAALAGGPELSAASSSLAAILGRTARDSMEFEVAREALRLLSQAELATELKRFLECLGAKLLQWGLRVQVGRGLQICTDAGLASDSLRCLRGEMLLHQGQSHEAGEVLCTLLEVPPSDARLRQRAELALARARHAVGEGDAALDLLGRLASGPTRPIEVLKTRADLLYRQGDYERALEDLETCAAAAAPGNLSQTDRDPDHPAVAALGGLAGVRFREGDATGAAEYLTRRKAFLDPTRHPSAYATALLGESVLACAAGELSRAAALCREAIRLRTQNGFETGTATALANLVQVEMLRGRVTECEEAFGQLVRLGDTVAHGIRAAAVKGMAHLRTRAGRFLEGTALARRALELARDGQDAAEEAEALVALGEALEAAGNFEGARTAADNALARARRMGSKLTTVDALLLLSSIEARYPETESRASASTRHAPAPDSYGRVVPAPRQGGEPASAFGTEASLERALHLAREARDLASRISYQPGVAGADVAIGELLLRRGDCARAIESFERILELNCVFEDARLMHRAVESASLAALGLADWERARRIAVLPEVPGPGASLPVRVASDSLPCRSGRAAILDCLIARALAALDEPAAAEQALARAADAIASDPTQLATKGAWQLASAWSALMRHDPVAALAALDRLPGLGLSATATREAVLLRAAAWRAGAQPERATGALETAAVPAGSDFVSMACLHALELLLREQGRVTEALRIEEGRRGHCPGTARWMELLGFTKPAGASTYVLVGGAPGIVREAADLDRHLERFDLAVDFDNERLYLADAGWLSLAGKAKPLGLLAALAREEGRLLEKKEIYEAVWGNRYNAELHQGSIHSLIGRVRRELRRAGSRREWIATEQHSGRYGLAPGVASGLKMRPGPIARG
ncbi:MAG: winged helix-turn-helix domain-containing protein [Candidatus Wallbacteria bacterium]|nr:winged helix-turn-helix domain-containing protein [Candidatus Wallbacteria bacterium]